MRSLDDVYSLQKSSHLAGSRMLFWGLLPSPRLRWRKAGDDHKPLALLLILSIRISIEEVI
jgi:hypothetical protein